MLRKVKYSLQRYSKNSQVHEELTSQKEEPHKLLLEALDHSMKRVFGETGALAVYHYLEESFLLKLDGILEKPLVFTQFLIEMYGETAAEFIEVLLVKDLSVELGMNSETD